ncbi:MAG TPA: helix-turn-helix domain-containing protein [Caldilineaceae bacterium]|nr:helix-turn-helix domain-containing protein [Caldilineaceae bacterium]
MTKTKLDEKETARDIGQEILDAVLEIQAGRGRRFEVAVPAAVEARHNVGLSQAEFAKLLGVSKRTIQEWEQGRREPSGAAQSLIKIAMQRPDVLREVLA